MAVMLTLCLGNMFQNKIREGYAKEMVKIDIQKSILKVMLPGENPLSNSPFDLSLILES